MTRSKVEQHFRDSSCNLISMLGRSLGMGWGRCLGKGLWQHLGQGLAQGLGRYVGQCLEKGLGQVLLCKDRMKTN